MPTASVARIEREATVDQPERDVDVLAEISEDKGSECEDMGRRGRFEAPVESEIDTDATGPLRIRSAAADLEPLVTMSRQGESRAVIRIAFYCSPEQV